MRKDGKPLTNESIETIWMYHDRILDVFGDDPASGRRMVTRSEFLSFCKDYKRETWMNGREEFRGMQLPL
jgi:hypothetical protein